MGVGKSTVGKKLAEKLNFNFIDTDDAFEAKYKINIHTFFEKYGEELFRKLEYKILVNTLKMKNVIVSTGGGTACFFDSMKLMNENGQTIYLEMTEEALVDRLLNAKRKRPLVMNKEENELIEVVGKKLAERRPFYAQASLTYQAFDIDIEELLNAINQK
jgi:shikimate kinase